MTAVLPTFSILRQRYQYLRGETDYTTVDAVNDSNINAALQDAFNLFDWSFSNAKTTGTLSSGTFNLPTDYNPTWHIPDARIVNSGVGDDLISKEIAINDTDFYNTDVMVHWITYDRANSVYVFNSNQTTGTVTYWYHWIPTTLVNSTDICPINEAEGLAMLALGKNWVGDERNAQLALMFTQQGTQKLAALYQKDVAFGPFYEEGNFTSRQPQLNGYGADPGLNISTK